MDPRGLVMDGMTTLARTHARLTGVDSEASVSVGALHTHLAGGHGVDGRHHRCALGPSAHVDTVTTGVRARPEIGARPTGDGLLGPPGGQVGSPVALARGASWPCPPPPIPGMGLGGYLARPGHTMSSIGCC